MVAIVRKTSIIGKPESPYLQIYQVPPESIRTPIKSPYQAKDCDIDNLDLQVLSSPRPIVSNSANKKQGIYLVEFSLEHLDFSKLDQETFENIKRDVRKIENQENVKLLVLSFYDCHSLGKNSMEIQDAPQFSQSRWTVKGSDCLADALMEARTYCRLNGKELRVIHNEPRLHECRSLTEIPGFIHENLGDAIEHRNQDNVNYSSPNKAHEPPRYTYFLRKITVS